MTSSIEDPPLRLHAFPEEVTVEPKALPTETEALENRIAPMYECAITIDAWRKHFDGVGNTPALPENLDEIAMKPCPFLQDLCVGETHRLALVPAKLDGKPFSINLLGARVKQIKDPKDPLKRLYKLLANNKTRLAKKPVWVLITLGCGKEAETNNGGELKHRTPLAKYELPDSNAPRSNPHMSMYYEAFIEDDSCDSKGATTLCRFDSALVFKPGLCEKPLVEREKGQ